MKRTRVSMYRQSILSAATGERRNMSSSSGVLPSSGGGDPMDGTMRGSSAGLGGAGGFDGKPHTCCSGLGEPRGVPMLCGTREVRHLSA